jgi:hypothetical protein
MAFHLSLIRASLDISISMANDVPIGEEAQPHSSDSAR